MLLVMFTHLMKERKYSVHHVLALLGVDSTSDSGCHWIAVAFSYSFLFAHCVVVCHLVASLFSFFHHRWMSARSWLTRAYLKTLVAFRLAPPEMLSVVKSMIPT